MGHHNDAKISPKAALEKPPTTLSENRHTSPKMNVCRAVILSLLLPTGNNAQTYTRYRVPPLQSRSMVRPNVYTLFPPRSSVQIYLSSDNCYLTLDMVRVACMYIVRGTIFPVPASTHGCELYSLVSNTRNNSISCNCCCLCSYTQCCQLLRFCLTSEIF